MAAMLDTKGPEVRLKSFAAGSVMLRTGQEFTLTTRDIVGDEQGRSITYADLPGDVKAGDTILLDDGLVRLTVLETTAADVRRRVENDGAMKNNKGVNVPGIRLSMPYMSQRDREDILFGVEQGFDFIAASFVRTADDVRRSAACWMRQTPPSRSSPRLKTRRGSATWRRSCPWRTASWWPGGIWAWRSTSQRFPSSRRT